MSNMKRYLLLLFLPLLFLTSCSSTKVEVKKYNLADTNITFGEYNFKNFHSAFRYLQPNEAYNLAETEQQKSLANALNLVTQNKLDDAADLLSKIKTENDSLQNLWVFIPTSYYYIRYNWEKYEEYVNIRNDIRQHYSDSIFAFYNDKPKFNIDFKEDSVVIPIKSHNGIPIIKIKINGKYYTFIIDTGCSRTLIGNNIVNENNIIYDNKAVGVKTTDGSATVYLSFLPEIDLKDIIISNIPVNVINKNDAWKVKFLFITFLQADGFIGWDLLHRFDFTIDYKNKLLTLRKPVEKNIEQKNLFWYQRPIIKFYTKNNYPLLFFFDTGSDMSSINTASVMRTLGVDTNKLKKRTERVHGLNNWIKKHTYKYNNFECFTLSNNDMIYLAVNKSFLENIPTDSSPIVFDGTLGSNWFKNKVVRVDMKNGLFEISE